MEQNPTTKARLYLILTEIAKGTTPTKIVNKYTNEWGLDDSTVMMYHHQAIEMLKNHQEEYIKEIRDIEVDRLTNLYADCMAKGDTTTALKALDQLNKVTGVYVTQLNIGGDTKFNFSFGGDEPENKDTREILND